MGPSTHGLTRCRCCARPIVAYGSGYALHQGEFNRTNGDRLNNAITFSGTAWQRFAVGAMYALGNVAGNFHMNSAWSVGANYSHGPFSAALLYMHQLHRYNAGTQRCKIVDVCRQNWGDYQITPALSAIGGYQHTNSESTHWNQSTLGLDYFVSKRTDVYVSGISCRLRAELIPSPDIHSHRH
jgi:predicted porin